MGSKEPQKLSANTPTPTPTLPTLEQGEDWPQEGLDDRIQTATGFWQATVASSVTLISVKYGLMFLLLAHHITLSTSLSISFYTLQLHWGSQNLHVFFIKIEVKINLNNIWKTPKVQCLAAEEVLKRTARPVIRWYCVSPKIRQSRTVSSNAPLGAKI